MKRKQPSTGTYRYEDFLKLVAALGLFAAFVVPPLLHYVRASTRAEAGLTVASR